jgi:hypothetical protein
MIWLGETKVVLMICVFLAAVCTALMLGFCFHEGRLDSHANRGTRLERRVVEMGDKLDLMELRVLKNIEVMQQHTRRLEALERTGDQHGRKFSEWEKNGVGQRR